MRKYFGFCFHTSKWAVYLHSIFDESTIVIDKQPKPQHKSVKKIDAVMLIDDNPLTNELNERILYATCMVRQVIKATSAEEGIRLLAERKNQGKALPEIIFLDIIMPKITGWDFLDQCQTRVGKLKRNSVIMLTSSPDVNHLMECSLRAEVQDFIIKPLNDVECKRILDQHSYLSRFERA